VSAAMIERSGFMVEVVLGGLFGIALQPEDKRRIACGCEKRQFNFEKFFR
jgi:hypothetical protein